nr:hemagglutinin esterase protein [Bovine torovirus]
MLSLILFFPSFAFSATPVTPYYGPGHITSDWCGFGDSRSDCNNPYFPSNLDIPQQLCSKFSSKSSSSMFISLHWNNSADFVAYNYSNCGVEKVFYEGVNFSPHRQYSCYHEGTEGWVENKIRFYTQLYKMASMSRCIKLIDLAPPSDWPSYRLGHCASGRRIPDNPKLLVLKSNISTFVQFQLPSVSGDVRCDKHLVPFCYLDHGCFTADSYCHPFGVFYESSSFYFGYYDNNKYSGTEFHNFVCKYLLMEPGVYNASTAGKFLVFPTKSYCMDTINFTVPVQAVQSIWSQNRLSDDAIGLACKAPYCIFFNKTHPYLAPNGSDENHGDDEVRTMMQGLLVNSSCVSPQGSTPLALYSSQMIYSPNYGSCPQYYKLFETSSDENVDVTSSAYFVATWVLLVLVILLIFILISFCLSSH